MKDKKLKNFLDCYAKFYPKWAQEDFKEKIFKGYDRNNSIIMQIYCYLNLVNIKKTEYYLFYKYIKKNKFLSTNTLDACCGEIPIISSILNSKKYSITAVDKNIVVKDFSFPIKELKINDSFPFENYKSVVAFRPCVATETIIRNCLKKKVPFCICLCTCSIFPQEKYTFFKEEDWTNEKWLTYLKYIIAKYNIHHMKVTIDYHTNLFDKTPIICAK